jgi:XTP/dITP diphosphohydrolase
MTNSILFATSNSGKVRDMNRYLASTGVSLLSPKEFARRENNSMPPEVEETGSTYEENAKLKSEALFEWCGLPTLADDSGLEVTALHGEPGLYSARYAGEGCSFDDNIEKLLKNLQGVEDRSARFVCVLAYTQAKGDTIFFRGELTGTITMEKCGRAGFGYDPVFFVDEEGETLAELKGDPGKTLITHRTRAAEKLLQYLR